jgi:hypothetical protein
MVWRNERDDEQLHRRDQNQPSNLAVLSVFRLSQQNAPDEVLFFNNWEIFEPNVDKIAATFRKKIELFKFAVYQMPYVQSVMIFLIAVLSESNYLQIGEMTPTSPYPYLTLVMLASFFLGLWGTLMFFNLTFKNNLLTQNRYRFKTGIFKAAIFLINTQGTILEVLGTYQLIPCISPHVSSLALAYTIKDTLALFEGLVLGIINFVMYEKYHDHL